LPVEVQRLGVVTEKTSPDMLMVIHLVSPDETRDALFLSNYASSRCATSSRAFRESAASRLWGAGEYSMRVWLDPAKLAARGMTASEVVSAIASRTSRSRPASSDSRRRAAPPSSSR
jgi:gold/copper resistance efflux pump